MVEKDVSDPFKELTFLRQYTGFHKKVKCCVYDIDLYFATITLFFVIYLDYPLSVIKSIDYFISVVILDLRMVCLTGLGKHIQSLYMNTKTVNISLPSELMSQLDRVAKERTSNRSELIREAVRSYLRRRQRWEALFSVGRRQAKRLGLTEDDVIQAVREIRGKGKI